MVYDLVKGGKFLNNENMFKNMIKGTERCQDIASYFGFNRKYDPLTIPPAYVKGQQPKVVEFYI